MSDTNIKFQQTCLTPTGSATARLVASSDEMKASMHSERNAIQNENGFLSSFAFRAEAASTIPGASWPCSATRFWSPMLLVMLEDWECKPGCIDSTEVLGHPYGRTPHWSPTEIQGLTLTNNYWILLLAVPNVGRCILIGQWYKADKAYLKPSVSDTCEKYARQPFTTKYVRVEPCFAAMFWVRYRAVMQVRYTILNPKSEYEYRSCVEP